MKKWVMAILISMLCASVNQARAQSQEVQQLLLNIEKLAQLKEILKNLEDGYEIVFNGYTTIKNLSEGNFNLHEAFLDRLLEVNPAVRNYKKIASIINLQLQIVKEYKSAYTQFKSDKNFTIQEIRYLGTVYSGLIHKSIKGLEELSTIITAGQLRMSDDERLQAIDRVYNEMQEKFGFLKDFNDKTKLLALQREKEQTNIIKLKKVYGIHN